MWLGSAYGMNCNFKQRFRSGTCELLGWQTTFNNLSIYPPFLPQRGHLKFQKQKPSLMALNSLFYSRLWKLLNRCYSVFICVSFVLSHCQNYRFLLAVHNYWYFYFIFNCQMAMVTRQKLKKIYWIKKTIPRFVMRPVGLCLKTYRIIKNVYLERYQRRRRLFFFNLLYTWLHNRTDHGPKNILFYSILNCIGRGYVFYFFLEKPHFSLTIFKSPICLPQTYDTNNRNNSCPK